VRPIELQWEYLDHAKKYVKESEDTPANAEILGWWESVLTGLDDDPLALHRELDWVAKFRLVEAYRERDGLAWDDPKLRLIDLQYHDVRRDRGLYHRLLQGGKVERLVSEAEIEAAVTRPPEDTRAYFRGNCIRRYPHAIVAASWDSVIFDTGRDALQRVPMREPLKGTRDAVEDLFAEASDAASLVDRLQA
jgi:Pup amidohydrolase